MGQGRRFHLQQRIGSGAYGEVFLAEQDSGAGFRKRVAIKLLHSRLEGTADAGRRFRDEARILGRLSHRHIVTVLDLVQLDERWAVIMDYVPGADLEHVLDALHQKEAPFPVPAALEAASAICAALDAAFQAPDGKGGTLGVVHRDIKPSNVRLTADGEIKVLDFGVASVNMETREAETGMHRMGTERYMAPERILGEDSGPAGDIYAVGTTLAELLLGEPIGRTPVLPDRHLPFVDDVIERIAARLDGPEEVVEAILEPLRASLSGDVDSRPTAAEWCEALSAQARGMSGEPLSAFSRRFVGEVSALLDQQSEPVSGILSEGTMSAGGASLAASGVLNDTETFVVPEEDLPPPPRSSNARGIALVMGLAAGVGALSLLVLVAAAMGMFSGGPPVTPPAVAAEPAPIVEEPPIVQQQPEPVPEVVVVEPEPEPEVAPAPVAPKPVRRPRPVAETRGAEVDRAMFVVTDASSLKVDCGGVTGTGSQAVRLRHFTGGSCALQATYLGRTLKGTAKVTSVREVRCTPTDEALLCD